MRTPVIAYAAAHFGKSLLWHCSGLIFLFYLTEVVGFAPAFAGGLLAASLLLNAGCDLLVGWAIGRRVRSLRAAALAQALGACFAAAAFVAFAAVGGSAADDRTIAAIVGLFGFRIGYALLDVPQNAILAFATGTDRDRAHLTAVRYAAAGAALLTVTVALAPWISTDASAERADWFSTFALAIGGLVVATSLALLWATRDGAGQLEAPSKSPAAAAPQQSISFAFVLVSIVAFSGFAPIFSKLEAYLVAFALPDGLQRYFMVAVATGQVAAQPLWAFIGARTGLLALYRTAAWAMVAATLAFVVGASAGGAALLITGAAYGAASSGMLVGIWSCLATSASQNPAKTTLRFGQFTFCSKLAQAGCAAALGAILQAHDYAGPSAHGVLVAAMATGPLAAAGLCLVFSFAPRAAWDVKA